MRNVASGRDVRVRAMQIMINANEFLKTHDKNEQTDSILLAFSKALDMMSHKYMLKKLEAIRVACNTIILNYGSRHSSQIESRRP